MFFLSTASQPGNGQKGAKPKTTSLPRFQKYASPSAERPVMLGVAQVNCQHLLETIK
jgi:hypothetical protein